MGGLENLENFHILEYDDLTFDVIYNLKILVCWSLIIKNKILCCLYNEILGMLYILEDNLNMIVYSFWPKSLKIHLDNFQSTFKETSMNETTIEL